MERPEEIKVEEEALEKDIIPEQEEVAGNKPEVEEGKTETTEEHSVVPEGTAETETKPEVEELEQAPKEESEAPVDDNGNKDNKEEDKVDGPETVEEKEENPTEPDKATEPAKTAEPKEEPETKQEEISPEQADLIAQLEELRAEKADREALEACNKEVMKVEEEYNKCSDKISEALKVSFAQNNIDPSKTLEELKKEDPAKATLAMQFISQAQELKTQLENAAIEEIKKQQNEVIYRVAAREFEKTGLNLEQAQEAVKTFKRIVNEVGIVDLGDDLKMKVQMAAGRAKMVVPEGIIAPEVEPAKAIGVADDDTIDLKEPSLEKEEVEPTKEPEPEKDVPPTPVVEKPKTEDFEEGVTGSSSTASGSMVSEFNVLEELAKLPYKEQRRFYKEHEDLITKALVKRQK